MVTGRDEDTFDPGERLGGDADGTGGARIPAAKWLRGGSDAEGEEMDEDVGGRGETEAETAAAERAEGRIRRGTGARGERVTRVRFGRRGRRPGGG